MIVVFIAASAALAGFEAVRRLLNPADVSHLAAVAGAGLIGFAGNELVAQYRIRVGRRIGSAALVADGLHARTDGFTSLGVLVSAGGLALGWRWADPVVGLAITAAILVVLAGAARQVYRRLMDAVDPALVDTVEETLRETDRGAGRRRRSGCAGSATTCARSARSWWPAICRWYGHTTSRSTPNIGCCTPYPGCRRRSCTRTRRRTRTRTRTRPWRTTARSNLGWPWQTCSRPTPSWPLWPAWTAGPVTRPRSPAR